MAIPQQTTVLVIGGGPGGSYAACALAREGVDCVVLEADKFPRYHIGESMIASMRHFLRFIDLDETFDNHGFNKKKGAAFKLNDKPVGFTDFIAAGGPQNYAWNVIRSEADDLFFKHAAKSGAQTFDGVKVNSLEFEPTEYPSDPADSSIPKVGRPVSATWSRKEDGSSGQIKFDYVVDASGRAGVLSTKYLKNRKSNQGLKNIANWGYWKGADSYGAGTAREGVPYFEALTDASGWCWFIPLHNGTTSVGIVQNQDMATSKKRALGSPSTMEFYHESLNLAPKIKGFLPNAEIASEIKSASDWSYSASCYAIPHARIVGDAGCFIDPYFSSGVHLALSSALSAAVTIRAAMKGECDEPAAVNWHSRKVSEGYTRFLLVVLSAQKQIRKQDQPVLSDFDEDDFDKAFAFFRPIIQGTADVGGKLSQEELSSTLDFCLNAFERHDPEKRDAVMQKLKAAEALQGSVESADGADQPAPTAEIEAQVVEKAQLDIEELTPEELRILNTIRARRMMRMEDTMHIDNFGVDVIDGYRPLVKRGSLGLMKWTGPRSEAQGPMVDLLDTVKHEEMPEGMMDKEIDKGMNKGQMAVAVH